MSNLIISHGPGYYPFTPHWISFHNLSVFFSFFNFLQFWQCDLVRHNICWYFWSLLKTQNIAEYLLNLRPIIQFYVVHVMKILLREENCYVSFWKSQISIPDNSISAICARLRHIVYLSIQYLLSPVFLLLYLLIFMSVLCSLTHITYRTRITLLICVIICYNFIVGWYLIIVYCPRWPLLRTLINKFIVWFNFWIISKLCSVTFIFKINFIFARLLSRFMPN